MKRTSFSGVALVLAVSGCTVDNTQLVASAPERAPHRPLEVAVPLTEDTLPDDLTCVSAPLDTGGFSDVIRVGAWRNASGAFDVSLQRGPQFWRRSGSWFGENGETLPAARIISLDVDDAGALAGEDALGTVNISLVRDGNVIRGELVDSQCYQHIEAELTCWSYSELFGSPWLGVTGSLPAHFDWSKNACVDVDGEPTDTRNVLPVEVIRETQNGDCADLAGLSLNGDDFGYPELDGWFLPGARLGGARLFFANLNSATLDGADLRGLAFGYATVSGTFNDATTLPEMEHGQPCTVSESPWAGQSVTCTQ